jgi:hypothetical protein
MSSFKSKVSKVIKVNKKYSITIDNKHNEILNDMNKNITNQIPYLKEERNKLKKELEECLEDSTSNIEKRLDINDKLQELNQEIKNIKNRKKEYFLNNSKYIFDYFENKKNISSIGGNVASVSTASSKNKMISEFFKMENTESIDNYTLEDNNILQKYLTSIDDNLLDINSFVQDTDVCKYCNKGELIPLEDEGIMICNHCYRNIQYLIENDKPSYKEPPKEVCFYAYKRINHFKEILAQFQGKETTQIHPDVIENIKTQIKKERIDISQITNNKTKEILKKLGYNKYYEHIPFIKDKMGIKPPIMSPELEDTLCNLFVELQAPYSKFCPNDRVNFLNYYYTAYKLCELLGETHYLEHFPMLKDRDKRVEQDAIWKKICKELDWEFISTL